MIGGKKKEKNISNKEEGSVGEVEEMLQAAEEDLLLKLTVNSHTTAKPRTCFSSILDPDLGRRFDALKSPPASAGNTSTRKVPSPAPPPAVCLDDRGGDDELGRVLGEDLLARFAALKASSSLTEYPRKTDRMMGRDDVDDGDEEDKKDEDGVSKEEVDKVIEWAIDAARLDLSGRDDEVAASQSEVEDEEEDEDEEEKNKKKKGKPKKWFFF